MEEGMRLTTSEEDDKLKANVEFILAELHERNNTFDEEAEEFSLDVDLILNSLSLALLTFILKYTPEEDEMEMIKRVQSSLEENYKTKALTVIKYDY